MDTITEIRGRIIDKLTGISHNSIEIPIFDEVVNPMIELPIIDGAETYILIQDQDQQLAATQTVCSVRYNCRVTIKVVTNWGNVGNRKLSEDIRNKIFNMLTNKRGNSYIYGVKKIVLELSSSLTEYGDQKLSFSSILILNFIKDE